MSPYIYPLLEVTQIFSTQQSFLSTNFKLKYNRIIPPSFSLLPALILLLPNPHKVHITPMKIGPYYNLS